MSPHQNFVDFDLPTLIEYVNRLANGFFNACCQDIRTKVFAAHGMQLDGVLDLPRTLRPFDDLTRHVMPQERQNSPQVGRDLSDVRFWPKSALPRKKSGNNRPRCRQ